MVQRWDVFVSYAHEDAAWVQTLAENLHRAGLEVYFDRWEIAGGDRLADRLQHGLESAAAVVLVVSRAAVNRPWWREEFAAAMAGAVAGVQRLIPVLRDDVPLPPFVANRVWVDFRQLDSPAAYEDRVKELLRAVAGRPPGNRPLQDGRIVPPPGEYRAEGPRAARLRIDPQQVVLSTADQEWTHQPLGVDSGLRTLVWELARARARAGDSVVLRAPEPAGGVLHSRLIELGRALGARFLDGEAGAALARELHRTRTAPLRLAVQVDDPELADLPWETLVLPGQVEPLVLRPEVQLHRAVAVADPVAVRVPGPLRILAVIASPERGGGELLDYEAELARILSVVDPTRREQNAHVRVLNWGSREAIRAALAEERFHVLHISCHAEPGALVLETDTGEVDVVRARKFVADVLVADHQVPLVVLAGCSTALSARSDNPDDSDDSDDQQGEQALPGLARDLLQAGVPAVLAMTASVTDSHATDLCAQLYQELARRPEPSTLTELSTVRRRLEQQRRRGAGGRGSTRTTIRARRGPSGRGSTRTTIRARRGPSGPPRRCSWPDHRCRCTGRRTGRSSATRPPSRSAKNSATAPTSPPPTTSSASSPRNGGTMPRPSSATRPPSPSTRNSVTAPTSPLAMASSVCRARNRIGQARVLPTASAPSRYILSSSHQTHPPICPGWAGSGRRWARSASCRSSATCSMPMTSDSSLMR